MVAAIPHERPVAGRPLAEMTMPSGEAASALRDVLSRFASVEIRHGSAHVSIPAELRLFLVEALSAGAEGQEVTLVLGGDTANDELTSQEVADLLNVSRPHVTALAKSGKLAHRKVGNRHRFLLADVMAYKAHEDARRAHILKQMIDSADGYSVGDFSVAT